MISAKEQLRIITKGASMVVNEEELLKKLENSVANDRPLNVKFGMDPSAPDIHLGHAVLLRKVRQMQELGHRVTIVIGDFTGKIGDPTGKSKTRNALSSEQVMENAKTYCDQIFNIIDRDKCDVRFNSEWLSKLNFEDVIKLASTTTVARMLERDDFTNRYDNNIPILGICAGNNNIVRAVGGKVLRFDNKETHKSFDKYVHKIKIDKNSKLYKIIGKDEIMVNSRHKAYTADSSILKCVAYSDDGVVEVVEDESKKFYMAVQFHPESLYKTDENMNRIFEKFIEICQK